MVQFASAEDAADEWSLPAASQIPTVFGSVSTTVPRPAAISPVLPYLSDSPPPVDYASDPPMMASSPPLLSLTARRSAAPVVLGPDEEFELPSDQLQLSDQVR
jgi:hypothetical protein